MVKIQHVLRPEEVYEVNLAVQPDPRLARVVKFQVDGHGTPLFGDRLERTSSIDYRKLFLFEVEDAVVLGKSNVILNRENKFSLNTIVFNPANINKIFSMEPAYRFQKDKSGVLTYCDDQRTDHGEAIFIGAFPNFGHWLFNHLARLMLIPVEKCSLPLVVPEGIWDSQIELLELFGYPKDRLIILGEGAIHRFSRLFVPAMPWHVSNDKTWWSPWMITYLRNMLNVDALDISTETPTRRILVSRKSARWRRPLNETEIHEALIEHGFELVELSLLSVADQIRLAKQSEIIISPMGANSNIFMFYPKRRPMIEIGPPIDRMNVGPHFAGQCGLRFSQLVCTPSPQEGQAALDADYIVDISQLRETVESFFSTKHELELA